MERGTQAIVTKVRIILVICFSFTESQGRSSAKLRLVGNCGYSEFRGLNSPELMLASSSGQTNREGSNLQVGEGGRHKTAARERRFDS